MKSARRTVVPFPGTSKVFRSLSFQAAWEIYVRTPLRLKSLTVFCKLLPLLPRQKCIWGNAPYNDRPVAYMVRS